MIFELLKNIDKISSRAAELRPKVWRDINLSPRIETGVRLALHTAGLFGRKALNWVFSAGLETSGNPVGY